MELLNLPVAWNEIVLVDKDPNILEYLVRRWGASNAYIMNSLDTVGTAGRCIGHCHNRDHAVAVDLPESDIVTFGNPCQPYSAQRRCHKLPEEHELFECTFGETGSVLATLETQKPGIAILENVEGFCHKRKRGQFAHESPFQLFVSRAKRILKDGRQWFTGHCELHLDSYIFSGSHKPRSP